MTKSISSKAHKYHEMDKRTKGDIKQMFSCQKKDKEYAIIRRKLHNLCKEISIFIFYSMTDKLTDQIY